MKSFVRLCLSRPITTLTVHVLLLLAGIMSLQHLPLSALPDFSQNRINVRVPYPNASPTQVENEVIRPLEEALATLHQDTISSLPFRVQVQGKVEHLQDERIANRIRALLLAGIRFAVLWHQIGGRPWHLFVLRGRINRIATSMLEN